MASPTSIYDINVTTIDGQVTTLEPYKNKVMLIVNVASHCNYTPQYAGLENLYSKYRDQNVVVLGFPCNQFGKQEPLSEPEIKSFCITHYNVEFPLFAKINVNGKHTHPLYTYLKNAKPSMLGIPFIGWNFTKFLVDKNGNVVKRYAPWIIPQKIEQDIASLLNNN